jgi:hypothetical protein
LVAIGLMIWAVLFLCALAYVGSKQQQQPLQILVPPKDTYVPMREAATRVYEVARKHDNFIAYAADRTQTEDGILAWIAGFIAGQAKELYGKRPPSREIEGFTVSGGGSFRNFASEYWVYMANSPTYVELSVSKDDLDRVIAAIVAEETRK